MINGSIEYTPEPTESLGGLHRALIYALGDQDNHPLEAATLVTRIPEVCREFLFSYAYNVDFPGKQMAKPHVSLIELVGANYIEYSYGEKRGYMLNQAGLDHYREILEVDEQQIPNDIPEAEPSASSLVRELGAGAIAPVRAA